MLTETPVRIKEVTILNSPLVLPFSLVILYLTTAAKATGRTHTMYSNTDTIAFIPLNYYIHK
jgi:hypothetical protein